MRVLIPGMALAAVIGACSSAPARPPAPGGQPSTATLVRVVAHDYAFDSTHTVPAGLVAVRLVNQGHAIHMLGIARLDSGKTAADAFHALVAKRPMPWFRELGGPGAVSPGDSVTAYAVLEPGRYSMICWVADSAGRAHFMDGMISELDVTGTTAGAPVEPPPDIELRESDYHIEMSRTPTAGPHLFRMDNDGPQNHDVAIVRMLPGKTVDQVMDWMDNPGRVAPAGEALGGLVGVTRYGHAEFSLTLTPGNYVVMCLIPDVHDGKSHFRHGMVRRFTVT